jgi:hypothetical protein
VGHPHWYWQWSAPIFVGVVVIIGTIYYYTVQVNKGDDVLAEHRADELPPLPAMGEMAP